MRPVLAGKVWLHELKDGTYDLCDIADINEALDVEAENAWRVQESVNKRDGRI
jgi:hypothetical protein